MGHPFGKLVMVIAAWMLISSCGTTKDYDRAYRRAWRKIVNSQAWKDALVSYETQQADTATVFYPLPGTFRSEELQAWAGKESDKNFLDLYQSLVYRAYFRTITEAEQADSRIYEAYKRLRDQRHLRENRADSSFSRDLQNARQRYEAHRALLEGLRSWKSFNEYGSDDLEFFLKEHFSHAYELYRKGRGEEAILEYLIYRLADLYHFEEQEFQEQRMKGNAAGT